MILLSTPSNLSPLFINHCTLCSSNVKLFSAQIIEGRPPSTPGKKILPRFFTQQKTLTHGPTPGPPHMVEHAREPGQCGLMTCFLTGRKEPLAHQHRNVQPVFPVGRDREGGKPADVFTLMSDVSVQPAN